MHSKVCPPSQFTERKKPRFSGLSLPRMHWLRLMFITIAMFQHNNTKVYASSKWKGWLGDFILSLYLQCEVAPTNLPDSLFRLLSCNIILPCRKSFAIQLYQMPHYYQPPAQDKGIYSIYIYF